MAFSHRKFVTKSGVTFFCCDGITQNQLTKIPRWEKDTRTIITKKKETIPRTHTVREAKVSKDTPVRGKNKTKTVFIRWFHYNKEQYWKRVADFVWDKNETALKTLWKLEALYFYFSVLFFVVMESPIRIYALFHNCTNKIFKIFKITFLWTKLRVHLCLGIRDKITQFRFFTRTTFITAQCRENELEYTVY